MVVLLRILPHELDVIDMHQRQKKAHKQIPINSTHLTATWYFLIISGFVGSLVLVVLWSNLHGISPNCCTFNRWMDEWRNIFPLLGFLGPQTLKNFKENLARLLKLYPKEMRFYKQEYNYLIKGKSLNTYISIFYLALYNVYWNSKVL